MNKNRISIFKYFYSTLVVSLCCLTFLKAQNYTVSNYSVGNGLAQSTVYSIIQDQRGFMWFATYGGGLSRFDGVSFKTYSVKDGLSDGKIYALFEDSKSNLWIGTRKGITQYDGLNFINHKIPTDLPVRVIFEDKEGYIWIGTYGKGIAKFSDGKFAFYDKENDGLISNYVYDIKQLQDGNILCATRDGMNIFDGKRFLKYDVNTKHDITRPRSFVEDEEQNVWYGSYGGGLCIVNNYSHNCFANPDFDNTSNIMAIIKDSKQRIWVGTFGNGIFLIDGNEVSNYNNLNSNLNNNHIFSLYEDKSGDIWVGTYLGGVYKFSESAFYSLSAKDGLAEEAIETMYEDKGKIIFSSIDSKISVFDGKNIKPYENKDLIKGRITAILRDKKGNLWSASDGQGAMQYMPNGKINLFNKKRGFPSDEIFCLSEDLQGNIWMGTYGEGVIRVGKNGDRIFQVDNTKGLKSNQVIDILTDKKGRVWFATNGGGISKFEENSFEHIGEVDSVFGNDFLSIKEDIFGNIWFASNGNGIYMFNGEKYVNYNTSHGISSNNINLILFDNANNLWVGSEKGIDKIIFELKDEKGKLKYIINSVVNYGLDDGLSGLETKQKSALADSYGNLWFGTVNGLVKYNTKTDKFNTKPPLTIIKNIKLFYEDVIWSDYTDSIQNWTNIPKNLILSHENNHLTFEFVGINLSTPHGVKYKFMLEGYDKDWSKEVEQGSVTYSNIPPGTYTFMVKSKNEDDLWNINPTTFSFTILNPFWFTWWFISAFIIILAVLVFTVVKFREKNIRKRNLNLEKTVQLRTLELKREKENIEKIKNELENKNTQIVDSIKYAKKIQLAILPPDEVIHQLIPKMFVYYKAKDIVSGDFYWVKEEHGNVYFAAVDCTGHGVPGAFMSIVGYRLLELIVDGFKIFKPAEILDELHMQVLENLHKHKEANAGDINDGMDIALCCWNRDKNTLHFAGAHNSLYLVRNGELKEFLPDNRPIGMSLMKQFRRFNQHEIQLQKGDMAYIFTDGFADQFGGEHGKKYYSQNFQKFLLSISKLSVEEQKEAIYNEFNKWKGNRAQIDDVLVMGVRF